LKTAGSTNRITIQQERVAGKVLTMRALIGTSLSGVSRRISLPGR
jgi:hypothetical protein